MKKLFAIAVLGLVVLVSCKKSSSGGSSIQASVNNAATSNFTILTEGYLLNGGKSIVLTGKDGTSATSTYDISLNLSSDKLIVPGVYSDTSLISYIGDPYTHASIEYAPQVAIPGDSTYISGAHVSSPVTITVTAVTTTSIQGTFQGNLYVNGDSTRSKATLTNGKFNVNLILQN